MIGLGADFQYSADQITWTSLGNMVNIGLPKEEVKDNDGSYVQQPDAYERFLPALINGGEPKFKFFWARAQYNTARGLLRDSSKYFRIVFPDKISTSGSILQIGTGSYLKSVEGEVPVNDQIMSDVTIKASGAPSWTNAT